MACASNGPNNHEQWNNDLYTMMKQEVGVLRTRGFAVIALADFNAKIGKVPGLENNIDTLNSNTPFFKNFVKSLDLTILNTLPISKGLFTHFIEKDGKVISESILDYGLTEPSLTPFVTSFIIDSESRVDCGTDHALLLTTLRFKRSNFTINSKKTDIMSFILPADHNYKNFTRTFINSPDLPTLDQFHKLDVSDMAHLLTKTIFDSCCKTFLPNSLKKP